MATNNINISAEELLEKGIFRDGFKNGETPLDERNLNLLKDGVKLSISTMQTIQSEQTNIKSRFEDFKNEPANRENADKAIIEKIWGTTDIPEEGTETIDARLDALENSTATESAITNVISYIQNLSGVDDIKSIASNYANSNKKLREDITALQNTTGNSVTMHKAGKYIRIDDISENSHELDIIVSGKNLIPLQENSDAKNYNGVNIKYTDGKLNLNGTAPKSEAIVFDIPNGSGTDKWPMVVPNKAYTLSVKSTSGSVEGGNLSFVVNYYPKNSSNYGSWILGRIEPSVETTVVTKVSPPDLDGIKCYLYIPAGVTLNSLTIAPQLELGSVATPFEKYINPSSTDVTCLGKNLFNISNVVTNGGETLVNNEQGSLKVYGGAVSGHFVYQNGNDVGARLIDYCPKLKVGDTVTLSAATTRDTQKYIHVYKPGRVDGEYINGVTWLFGTPITITNDILYGRVAWYGDAMTGSTISQIQVEMGTKVTQYEQYVEPITKTSEDGVITALKSVYPTTTLVSDNDNMTIYCTYNKDMNVLYSELLEVIDIIGGGAADADPASFGVL